MSTANIQSTERVVSQRTIVRVKKILASLKDAGNNMTDLLYEHGLPDWFIRQISGHYGWHWMNAFWDLRSGNFFFTSGPYSDESESIVPEHFSNVEPTDLGEAMIRKLAATCVVVLEDIRKGIKVGKRGATAPLASWVLRDSESLVRSLQLDGFGVDKKSLKLVSLEGPISARDEEDRLSTLVKTSGLPSSVTVLHHIEDATSLYEMGKDHPSLNESRNILQSLIDGIGETTHANGKHSVKLPGGTTNRIEYLRGVGFLTTDEEAAFKSSWGSLSAGSHPGVPEREQARIGLVLALEFGQLLLIKFANWKANAFCSFS
jgi:hypothetical protein